MRRLTLLLRLLLLCAALPGCALTDPQTRPGTWQPTGANDANLRAMIADPHDLVHGQAGSGTEAAVAARAVARYRADNVKDLPDSALAPVSPLPGGSGASAAPASSTDSE